MPDFSVRPSHAHPSFHEPLLTLFAVRLVSHLLAMNVLATAGNDRYVMTKLSAALSDPSTGYADCYSYL